MPLQLEQPLASSSTRARRSRTLTTDLFEQLRSDILHNRLDPGSRLRFRDLRERYQSGLSPLREALMRLVCGGARHPRRPQRIPRRARSRARRCMDIANTLLELEASRFGWPSRKGTIGGRPTSWRVSTSSRSGRCLPPTARSIPEWEARNVAFHESLYAACGSPSLKLVCHVLYERHSRYRRLRTKNTGKPDRDVSKEHEALMRATIERDATTAIASSVSTGRPHLETCSRSGRSKKSQTEEPPAAAKSGARRRGRRRSDRVDGDVPHVVRRVKTPLRHRGLRDS